MLIGKVPVSSNININAVFLQEHNMDLRFCSERITGQMMHNVPDFINVRDTKT